MLCIHQDSWVQLSTKPKGTQCHGVMKSFNQTPGRNTGFDPSKGLEIAWLGGKPVLKNNVEPVHVEPVQRST
eukprot:440004-Prorocentrum_lima.AAC.1